ncbi:MAG TPA: sigma-70 family RNA polymerase sigma factor [Gemmataceae bacterium]|nr:sigma-70 family RNA polymerase sigma factor [Gemmataceae bacterium]
MTDRPPLTAQLQGWLARLRAGDASARGELIEHVCDRLRRLTRKMLKGYPGVKRYAETDDVLQSALLRLLRSLDEVQPATTSALLGLAATQIRRELLDLARHFYGPHGAGAHHASQAGEGSQDEPLDPPDATHDPSALAEWCEFHEQVEKLPAEEREAVDLLYYQGLPQADAAALLNVSVRTLQRRWQGAQLKLHQALKGSLPGL